MCRAMPYPCMTPLESVFRISMSRVPGSSSWRGFAFPIDALWVAIMPRAGGGCQLHLREVLRDALGHPDPGAIGAAQGALARRVQQVMRAAAAAALACG